MLIPLLIMFVMVGVFIVWAVLNPPPAHDVTTFTSTVDEKIVAPTGSGMSRASTTECVFTDIEGERHTFSDSPYYGEPCLLKVGDEITVTYDLTTKTVVRVEPKARSSE